MTGRVGGRWLFKAMAILLVVANIGAGLTSQVGAARLLFGMGRENVIPRRFFARAAPGPQYAWINHSADRRAGLRRGAGDEL